MSEGRWVNLTVLGSQFEVEADVSVSPSRYRHRPRHMPIRDGKGFWRRDDNHHAWVDGPPPDWGRVSAAHTDVQQIKKHDPSRPRCPTCGFPVDNFFDHVDRDGFAENGECT